jgi:spore maturation protein CgeB
VTVRVLVADTYYPAFLRGHYAERPELRSRPYGEQLSSLIERCFGTSDAYSRRLRDLGHSAEELIANCLPLQLSWAREQARFRRLVWRPRARLHRDREDWLGRRIAAAQIRAFRPDVLYVQDLSFFEPRQLAEFRSHGMILAGQIAADPPDERQLRSFDLLLTSFPHFVDRFKAMGIESEFLQIGFHDRVLARLRDQGIDPSPEAERPHALSFVGGIDPRYSAHRAGVELLERVSAKLPLEAWGYGADGLAEDSGLRRAYRGEAWGLDMYRVLARSRIVVNRHSAAAEGYANNMRLFEATGAGAMLVTEAAPNLRDYFEPGREVVTYDRPDDLMEKLSHYLEHDAERIAIATAGQRRTLRDHTYTKVMARLSEILEARLS